MSWFRNNNSSNHHNEKKDEVNHHRNDNTGQVHSNHPNHRSRFGIGSLGGIHRPHVPPVVDDELVTNPPTKVGTLQAEDDAPTASMHSYHQSGMTDRLSSGSSNSNDDDNDANRPSVEIAQNNDSNRNRKQDVVYIVNGNENHDVMVEKHQSGEDSSNGNSLISMILNKFRYSNNTTTDNNASCRTQRTRVSVDDDEGVDNADNEQQQEQNSKSCCFRSNHGWCINHHTGQREILAKCSRNGLLIWAIIVTILLIINLSISSGMFSKQQNQYQVSGVSAGICQTSDNNNGNNDNGTTDKNGSIHGSTTMNNNNNTDSTSTAGLLCGCPTCVEAIWNKPIGNPAYTCGERIEYLTNTFPSQYPTQVQACRQIAFDFPCDCGSCDPARCNVESDVRFTLPNGWLPKDDYVTPPTPSPVYDSNTYSMYCYPPEGQRVSYSNVWNAGYYVEVKESTSASLCGPGNNQFLSSNVVVDPTTGSLTLSYRNAAASEVRVLLPNDAKYSYGTYRFDIGTIGVSSASTGEVLSEALPKEIVFGLFTWDDTENYAVHENYNHEVDIEISRWNCETNADVQFLVQPPGYPQMHRFFSGSVNNDTDLTHATNSTTPSLSQGNHIYEFTWNPGNIEWYSTAGGGQNFTLTTEQAMYMDVPDYVQCMPDRGMQTEIRINLWNMLGAATPSSLQSSDDIVSVTITNFTYIPSTQQYIPTGGFCSKQCQCESSCDGGVCT